VDREETVKIKKTAVTMTVEKKVQSNKDVEENVHTSRRTTARKQI
jgi:hypothetical protein